MKLYIAAILALVAIACNHSGDSSPDNAGATPRRYAYPRIAAIDTAMALRTLGPVDIAVNTSATAISEREGWLTLSYPRLGATIYISATRTDDVAAAIANRRQRMALNLGDASASASEFLVGPFACTIVESADAGTTPVQFLAASADGVIVSGAATLSGPTAPADSIRPIVQFLAADAARMLKSLQ